MIGGGETSQRTLILAFVILVICGLEPSPARIEFAGKENRMTNLKLIDVSSARRQRARN
jgi:hypothetical protein